MTWCRFVSKIRKMTIGGRVGARPFFYNFSASPSPILYQFDIVSACPANLLECVVTRLLKFSKLSVKKLRS